MCRPISLHDEAVISVEAMVAKAECEVKNGNGTHPVEVWEYVLKCVKEHDVGSAPE